MKNQDFVILIVDDEIEYQNTMDIILSSKGYKIISASSGEEAINILHEHDIDLVITDLRMPNMSGTDLVSKVKEINREIDIIIVTAYGSIESAVEAIKLGAKSYFVKSEDPTNLISAVAQIAKIKELSFENRILRETRGYPEAFLETKNIEFSRMLKICDKAAASNINVLLLGESGVGKEVLANYIHMKSERKNKYFVPVNCQVFSSGLIESELFGHEKGAFTGATERRIGRFEQANGGTIFLDEIGDLPLETQSKLLRSIENHTIERLGSNNLIPLDIRVISATNKDINKIISEGRFREDLLFRINTLTISIPPLRERREDLPGLIKFFVSKIEREQKKTIKTIEKGVIDKLLNYNYPGNVRELKNILERLITLSDDGVISLHEVEGVRQVTLSDDIIPKTSLREARKLFEKRFIEKSLASNGQNVSKTAHSLQISERQLWNKISEYHIDTSVN